ncbi:MAG: energy transducer TonB [Proteobacteria bacterium]|nr:energy transducer TonB [Pseudomonadota bacterium]
MVNLNDKEWQVLNFFRVQLSPCLTALSLLVFSSCTAIATGPAVNSGSDLDPEPPESFTRGLIPQRTPVPLYPLRARNVGIEGWVMLTFTVNEDGNVVGNTIETIDEEPEGYFELSAINAARRMTFENTQGEPIEDVRYVFRYELQEENSILVDPPSEEIEYRELISMRYITPNYPEVALELRIEGHVEVSFTVTTTGAVENIRIQESEPPGVFNEAAIAAASRLRYEPRIVFNAPVRVDDVRYRFVWELQD